MKVQTRLSLFSSFVFGIIFIIISLFIYALYSHNAEKSIYKNLRKTSYITAIFYLEEDELDKDDFSRAKKQFEEFVNNSFYQVYNEENQVRYGTTEFAVSASLLNKIREKEEVSFREEGFFCYGIFYEDNEGDFVIITREKRDVLTEQMNALLWILGLALIIGISAIIVLSKWMANRAYRPFRTVIRQVKNNISTNKLDKRIKLLGTNDELQDLIQTFNELLEKISDTFIIQKNFVSYVSHEFKTPLASMQGNLEVFSIKERTPEEYHQLSKQLIQQIKELEEILSTLMVISDLKSNTEVSPLIRIDELIWEIISKISVQYRKSNILVNIEVTPQDEAILFVSHDSTQLLMALFNLIENAVKYSQSKPVEIYIRNDNGKLTVSIVDKGIGIPSEQLKNISKPFYRADNTQQIRGSGIGLSIALNILEKNGIEYKIETTINEGTTVILLFK